MSDHTISSDILLAIRDTVEQYLPAKVAGFKRSTAKWHFTDTYIDSKDAPAITLVDKGWTKITECNRGHNADGSVSAGLLVRRYTIEAMVWLKGKSDEELRETLRVWCDGMAAVLDANHRLGEDKIIGSAKSGAGHETMNSGSAWFGAGQVRIDVTTYTRQGETTL